MKLIFWHSAAGAVLALSLLAAPAAAQKAACPPVMQAPTPAQIEAARAKARDHGLLWRITKDGRSSYLYGTIHLGKLDWALPGPEMSKALASAEVVALELDASDPATLQKLQAGMARRADEPPLPAALQRRLAEETQAACLPPGALDTQQPAVQAITLVLLSARWEGLEGSYAMEHVLTALAQAQGIPVAALETVEEQLEVLIPSSQAARDRLIEQALGQLKSGAARRAVKRLTQAWAEGRLEDLARYEQWCECVASEEDRALLRRMNDDRNPAIASRIERLHAQGKTVFAGVGALHMTGPKSLPALMKQRGFEVERVSFSQ